MHAQVKQTNMKQKHYLQVHGISYQQGALNRGVYLVTIRIMGYCLVLLYIFNAVQLFTEVKLRRIEKLILHAAARRETKAIYLCLHVLLG